MTGRKPITDFLKINENEVVFCCVVGGVHGIFVPVPSRPVPFRTASFSYRFLFVPVYCIVLKQQRLLIYRTYRTQIVVEDIGYTCG